LLEKFIHLYTFCINGESNLNTDFYVYKFNEQYVKDQGTINECHILNEYIG
jgi:hypothetical protein